MRREKNCWGGEQILKLWKREYKNRGGKIIKFWRRGEIEMKRERGKKKLCVV